MSGNRILWINAGGTISAEAYDNPHEPPEVVNTLKGDKNPVMATIKSGLSNYENVDGFSWRTSIDEHRFVKDSQLFTPDDMKELAYIIKKDHQHDKFIITHGTDGMARNAAMLDRELAGSGKVVTFVGAMVPLSMRDKHESDGIDALNFALNNINDQPPGVFMVANDSHTKRWKFFDPSVDLVEKDYPTSRQDLKFTLKTIESRAGNGKQNSIL